MSDYPYLKRLFQAYYIENKATMPLISSYKQREFGFLSWDEKSFMRRHMSFESHKNLTDYLINDGPRHIYSSGALYLQPDNLDMKNKEYQGCDLIIDIDVDHFYTPCKNKHDLWWCKECDAKGFGMIQKCPECKKLKIKKLAWICDDCLDIAKNEIYKLVYDFFIPDFNMNEEEMNIAFSGHRGYHLKVENENLRNLSSEDRREIADYVSGDNLSFEILGLRKFNQNIYGLNKNNIGWPRKIVLKLEELLKNKSNRQFESFLLKLGLDKNRIKSFMSSKDDFLKVISGANQGLWIIPNFGLTTWKTLLSGVVNEIGAEIDEPVTIDIHRLIRYPGSLHGKSGFKVQELTLKELEIFNPLDEPNERLDPIIFKSKNTLKLEITELQLPITKLKGESYGPYNQGDVIEVPFHVGVFFLCKDVAKTI